jgi:conjugal transfer mating pair stabilization protein TraG
MSYEIYVISNSDMFREGLNAIAAFCRSAAFKNLTWIGAAIGITATAFAYLKQHDVMVFLKWVIGYFFVFNILLGVTTTVAVINTSDQTVPPQVVDGVPIGIALPAHLITAIGYGISTDLETDFTLPNEAQYNQTGMLFGSNLFRLSLASQLDDPEVMSEMNDYVRSCVVGDVLINHKYTFNDLLHAEDMWGLMTQSPSPIRGMFVNGVFNTCKQAATMLTAEINKYSTSTDSNSALAMLGKFIPTKNAYAPAAINNMLGNTYKYFKNNSDKATSILQQNIAINAFRSGIKNYAAEAGSVAGMENIANTVAMNNVRMSWATSQHIGIETLPLMQVVLLLLLICLFPIIAALTLIPGMGLDIFKNYIYSLLWLESWPIMYTILNMAMNFYMQSGNPDPVTLSNINLLAQEHSDISGVAGYLILAIPFLSMGLVKGMASTFNNAAQYLGGMAHSIAQGSATSVATGNESFGNVSTDNVTSNNLSANKHDTNFTSMSGMNTQQLGNAATVTSTPMGQDIYQTASGMSQLAVSANAAQSTATSLSQQVDQSLSSALQQNTQFVQSMGHNASLGDSKSSGVNSNIDNAMSTIQSMTQGLAQREGISDQDAFQRLSQISGSAGINGNVGLKIIGSGVMGSMNAAVTGSTMSTHNGSYTTNTDSSISDSDARNFTQAMHTVQNYSDTHSISDQNTTAQNTAIQMGADLNQAQRLSNSAQFIRSNSDAINENFNQAFANYVQTKHPEAAQEILSATGDSPMLAKQQQLANEFIQTHATQLANQYATNSSSLQQSANRAKYMTQNYQESSHNIMSQNGNFGVSATQANTLSNNVERAISSDNNKINMQHGGAQYHEENFNAASAKNIANGEKYSKTGIAHHALKEFMDS